MEGEYTFLFPQKKEHKWCVWKTMPKYQRRSVHTVEEVLPLLQPPFEDDPEHIGHLRRAINATDREKFKTRINGVLGGTTVGLNSIRLYTYKRYGVICVSCGLVGSFFAVERQYDFKKDKPHGVFHLNLYAIDDGEEVMMTSDHIIPKSKGGSNAVVNRQPMCIKCNGKKGNVIPSETLNSFLVRWLDERFQKMLSSPVNPHAFEAIALNMLEIRFLVLHKKVPGNDKTVIQRYNEIIQKEFRTGNVSLAEASNSDEDFLSKISFVWNTLVGMMDKA